MTSCQKTDAPDRDHAQASAAALPPRRGAMAWCAHRGAYAALWLGTCLVQAASRRIRLKLSRVSSLPAVVCRWRSRIGSSAAGHDAELRTGRLQRLVRSGRQGRPTPSIRASDPSLARQRSRDDQRHHRRDCDVASLPIGWDAACAFGTALRIKTVVVLDDDCLLFSVAGLPGGRGLTAACGPSP